ncbi:MAG: TonB family protein [Sphaerochaeta sp.]
MNKLQTMILGLTLTVLMIALLFLPLRIKETEEPLVAPPTAATLSLVRRVSAQTTPQQQPKAEEQVQDIQKPKEQEPLEEKPAQELLPPPVAVSPVPPVEPAMVLAQEEPQPSLIEGYYPIESVTEAPVFDRKQLALRIVYPPLAKRQGKEGLVMLRLFLSDTGLVERILIEEDPGYGLAQAAVSAFTGFQAKPAIREGNAVPVTLRYPVRFSLN